MSTYAPHDSLSQRSASWGVLAVLAPVLALLALWFPASAASATVTVLPYAEHGTLPGTWLRWGGDPKPETFKNIDEVVPGGVNTGDAIYTLGGTTDIASYDLASPEVSGPVDSGTIGLNVRTGNTNTVTYWLRRADSSVIATGTFATTSTATSYSLPFTNHISASDTTGMYIQLQSVSTGVSWYAASVSLTVDPIPFTTLLPNADKLIPSGWGYWGVGPANIWRNIDESVPGGASNSDWVYTPLPSPNTAAFDFTTAASGIVGYVKIGTMMSTDTAAVVDVKLRRPDTTIAASGTILVSNGIFANSYIGAHTYMTQADVDGMYVEITGDNAHPTYMYALSVDATSATVSGTLDSTTNCNGITPVVGVAVNGTLWDTVPCQSGTGNYAASPIFAAGDIVTTFYNGQVAKGVTYTRTAAASTTPITGVDIATNQARIRTLSGTSVSNANLLQFDQTEDSDIPVSAWGGTEVLVANGSTLVVQQGTFTQTDVVHAYAFWVRSGATYAPGSGMLDILGSGTGVCNNSAPARPFCIAGTFTPGTGIVYYRGTGATVVSGGTYANIAIQSSASNTFQLGAATDSTINAASMSLIGSSGNAVVSTTTASPTVNVSGAVSVDGSITLGGSGTGTMTIGGSFTGTGQVNFTGGSVILASPATNTTLNAGGTLPGTPWQFATLRTQNTSFPQRTVTIPATSREIRVSAVFSADLYADLNASAMTQPFTVTGDLAIAFGSSISAPPVLEVQGNFTNGGTFYSNTGTVNFTGSGTSAISWTVGAFYDVDISTPSKVVTVASNFTINRNLSVVGGTCATPATLRSNSAGAARTIARTGGTWTANYASFRDIAVSGTALAATNSGDLGNNTSITFSGNACSAPTSPFADSTNAAAGSTQPTTIDGRTTFHMSVANSTPATMDRYRTDVNTSPLDSSVRALWPLDSSGADRSSTGNTTVGAGGVGYVAGATNFSQAASFDGVNDQFSAPSNAAYNTTSYTVDLWFKASTTPTTWPTMVSRAGSMQAQFQIGFNTPNGTLTANMTTGNGLFEIATPSGPWLDNTWHHVAFTANSAKQLRLYVDGVQYGSTVTYTGSMHVPAAPIYIGGTQSFATNYFAGQIDDVQFTAGEPDALAIAGYAATARPHAQSVWQSTGYGTATGAALSGSCVGAVRCADIIYGGPNIRIEGARYYATHQLRTTAGLWTNTVTDWFQTSDAISVTTPGSVSIPAVGASTASTASFNVVTNCTNATGCNTFMSAPSTTVALIDSGGTSTIPPYTIGAPTTWATGGSAALGFTILSTTSGKNTTTWGTGVDFSNLALLKFTGLGHANTLLYNRASSGAETTTVGVRLDTGTTAPGSYSGTIDVIAMDAP